MFRSSSICVQGVLHQTIMYATQMDSQIDKKSLVFKVVDIIKFVVGMYAELTFCSFSGFCVRAYFYSCGFVIIY